MSIVLRDAISSLVVARLHMDPTFHKKNHVRDYSDRTVRLTDLLREVPGAFVKPVGLFGVEVVVRTSITLYLAHRSCSCNLELGTG